MQADHQNFIALCGPVYAWKGLSSAGHESEDLTLLACRDRQACFKRGVQGRHAAQSLFRAGTRKTREWEVAVFRLLRRRCWAPAVERATKTQGSSPSALLSGISRGSGHGVPPIQRWEFAGTGRHEHHADGRQDGVKEHRFKEQTKYDAVGTLGLPGGMGWAGRNFCAGTRGCLMGRKPKTEGQYGETRARAMASGAGRCAEKGFAGTPQKWPTKYEHYPIPRQYRCGPTAPMGNKQPS